VRTGLLHPLRVEIQPPTDTPFRLAINGSGLGDASLEVPQVRGRTSRVVLQLVEVGVGLRIALGPDLVQAVDLRLLVLDLLFEERRQDDGADTGLGDPRGRLVAVHHRPRAERRALGEEHLGLHRSDRAPAATVARRAKVPARRGPSVP
jgi:hypothetical protein